MSIEFFKTIIDRMEDLVFVKDREYRYVFANSAVCNFIGISSEDMIGKTDYELFPREQADIFRNHDKFVLETEKEDIREEQVIDSQGNARTMMSRKVILTRENGEKHIVAIIRDITENKRAEADLKLNESRLEALLTLNQMTNASLAEIAGFALEEAVHLTQSEIGYVAFVNEDETVLTMHAWSKSAMKECKVDDKPILYPVVTTGLWGEAVRRRKPVITNDYSADSPWKKGLPEGHVAIRKHMNVPIFDGDKIVIVAGLGNKKTDYDGSDIRQLALLMGGMWRILQRKRTEEERARLEAQLLQSQKMEAIGTMAGGIAHDFNNILTALMGYTGLVEMGIPRDHHVRSYLEQIINCTAKAANFTQSLLAFSRKQVMELKPHRINTIIRELEKLLRRLLTEDIELKVDLEQDATIMADLAQMDQVLINLVSNARDAMPGGGTLGIKAAVVELDKDFVQAYGIGEPGSYVLVSVFDTGVGMNEATKEKIFEPFFTTKEVGKGTGLGLSIVYGIVRQHGGFITVSSETGKGTEFLIYLPVAKVTAIRKSSSPVDIKGGTETILFAEDNPDIRIIARETFRKSGYTMIEATDGEEAVEKFIEHQNAVDLVILDVVMPRKNGKAAYDEIMKIRPAVKTLFMSGYTGDVVLDKGVQEEFGLNYISKPLSPIELLKKVREVIDGV